MEFGKNLPLTSLLERPTIAELAQLLENGESSAQESGIVAIRGGGNKPPLFVVHSITGSLLFWQRFLKDLDPDQPVFGLRPPEAGGIMQPFEGIEVLASRFADQLVASYKDGAFRLAGYSFGGPLAYEVARQLHQRGRSVALLAIVDAYARIEKRSRTDSFRLIPSVLVNVWYWLIDDMIPSGPRSALRHFVRFTRECLSRRPVDRETTPKNLQKKPAYLRAVRQSGKQIMRRYRCKPFDGAVTLLRNRLQSWKRIQRPDYGWGNLVPRVNVRIVTFCRHYQMVKEPHVRQIAAALQEELDAVENV
jgi:aspartate racemase